MRFSQRIGKQAIKTILQVESMDTELRNRLWNNINEDMIEKLSHAYPTSSLRIDVLKEIWRNFLVLPMNDIPIHAGQYLHFITYMRDWFYKAQWYKVYDLIEFLANFDTFTGWTFIKNCNISLKKEVAGYRIIDQKIVQITSSEEIEAIEDALENTDKYKSVNNHLKASLDLFSDRSSPDYRNSIKESISAVEAFCGIVVGDNKATLGNALAIIEKKHKLHSSLKEAYKKIYGYTSDADGIRHAMLEDSVSIEAEDAKFMLVSCSAFINYLKSKLKL